MTNNVETEMTMDDVMELLMDNDFFFQVMESGGSDWVREILKKVERAEAEADACEDDADAALLLASTYADLVPSTRTSDVYLGYELLEKKPVEAIFTREVLSDLSVNLEWGPKVSHYFTLSKLGKEFLENPPYRLTPKITGKKYTDWLSAKILKLVKDHREHSLDGYADMLIDRIQRIVESRERPSQRW